VTTNSLFSSNLKVSDNGSIDVTNPNPGNSILDIINEGNGNVSGINFTRERSSGTGINGGSIFMPSNTANNEAFLYIQAQSANAQAGQTGALSADNGVRLKLHGDDGIFSIETGSEERVRITSDGKVGIGTSNPSSLLTVYDSANANDTPLIRLNAFRPAIRFVDRSSSSTEAEIVADGNSLRFRIEEEADNDTALEELMRLKSNGHLGIGTNNPDQKLEVFDGAIKIDRRDGG
ncbi:MAG: hypothetical protein VXY93_16265, partial [Pseudomonadota bacterium]|nr:hypothetical protein [Pseudomonadota bacterium]